MDPVNKKRTMGVFERLKREGAPKPQRTDPYLDTWSGELMPSSELQEQEQFDEDMNKRTEQSQVNKTTMPSGLDDFNGVRPGPTGTNAIGSGGRASVSEAGAVPYAQEYFQRRRKFRRQDA